jgi:hypothetical protein
VERWTKDVFVVGAGFSRAVWKGLPLTVDLFDRCLAAMREEGLETSNDSRVLDAYARFGEDFEVWLTWLRGDQPWVDEAGSLRNRAAFSDVTRALGRVILNAENEAIRASGGTPPAWLNSLVEAWANRSVGVISLNYDALVEKAYTLGSIFLYTFMPAHLGGTGRLGGPPPAYRFDLFKLHGSITWYVFPSGPGQGYGPVYDAELQDAWATDDEPSLAQRAGGRRPLLIPPVLGKDPFFDRPELRDQWLRAEQRLQQAENLFLIGYSLPAADLTMRYLLDRVSPDCSIYVVNCDPASGDHFEHLLRSNHGPLQREFVGLSNAIERMTEAYVHDSRRWTRPA